MRETPFFTKPQEKKFAKFARRIAAARGVRELPSLHPARHWENIADHCLVEAARTQGFAKLLRLPKDIAADLFVAALLHDGHKQLEVEAIQKELAQGGTGYAASNRATRKYLRHLRASRVNRSIVSCIQMAGGMPDVLVAAKRIVLKKKISHYDLARLLMYYIDAYTRGGLLAQKARGGKNDIDRRRERNEANKNYTKINQVASRVLTKYKKLGLSGMTTFEAMAYVGHEAERVLCQIIYLRSKVKIKPIQLPEKVDAFISFFYEGQA